MNISEALSYIHSVKWTGSKPGLSRTQELLRILGNPEKKLKFVHIAGTNGKGSTAAMIESVLRKAGYKTGLYTSPYIRKFNERMMIMGEMITDSDLCELCEVIRPFADAMEDSPTEFELITALAMLYFERYKCDIVVLEVGLGGELDSTNVIDTPELAVITAIGLDHTAELGPAIKDIAAAKAGIIKPGGTAVVYGAEPDALEVFEKKCAAVGAKLIRTDFTRLSGISLSLSGAVFDFTPYSGLEIKLAGAYQPRNAALAVTALEALRGKGFRITDNQIITGLKSTRWAGRFEVLRGKSGGAGPTVILDGAHNTHGIEAACESFERLFGDQKLIFLVGVMADKDVSGMMAPLLKHARLFITVTPPNPRAMKAKLLADLISGLGGEAQAFDSISGGVKAALSAAGNEGTVAALGSLYFSEEIRKAYEATGQTLI